MNDNEPFSNPVAPQGFNPPKEENLQQLTNDDFRKLLMTPRPGTSTSKPDYLSSVRSSTRKSIIQADNNKKKKKKLYAAIKKQEDDTLAELAKRYRDRARERRDGVNPDYQNDDPLNSLAAYRAVAPDIKTVNAAERRKQIIEESKYLGGDMKHTHLVKGLDYALLHKVKAELIENAEVDEGKEAELDNTNDSELKSRNDDFESFWEPKSTMAKNIINSLAKKSVNRNDLFLPGRMAYIVDLIDECADEIPTTVIRSKADCPNWDSTTLLSTNDIVINKLREILSYLRQGGVRKKKRDKSDSCHNRNGREERIRRDNSEKIERNDNQKFDSIYDDIGEYVPSHERREKDKKSSSDRRDRIKEREKGHKQEKRHSYFDKSSEEYKIKEKPDSLSMISADINPRVKLSNKLNQEPKSYAECYPGAPENDDATLDSDDEVDYTKMDLGNKKCPIRRWDFDTQEEYGEYMSNKEAMPKAAFQYGVKMADGRKTRRIGKKDEKAKIDRDLKKINALLVKRKDVEISDEPNKKLKQ